jgi:hypothetical protein
MRSLDHLPLWELVRVSFEFPFDHELAKVNWLSLTH